VKISILAIMGSLLVLAIGGLIMIASINNSQQFTLGLGLFLVGLASTGFILWFIAVNGKTSFFRRRIRPMPGSTLN
jgi:hypothetical protein